MAVFKILISHTGVYSFCAFLELRVIANSIWIIVMNKVSSELDRRGRRRYERMLCPHLVAKRNAAFNFQD